MKASLCFLGTYVALAAVSLAIIGGLSLLSPGEEDWRILLATALALPLVLGALEAAILLPEMRRVAKAPPPEPEKPE